MKDEYTPMEILNMDFRDILHNSDDLYYKGYSTPIDSSINLGIVSAKWVIETPIQDILMYNPIKSNLDEVKMIMNLDINELVDKSNKE